MIVAIDYCSKWPEVATCSSVTSDAVIEFLNRLFDRSSLVEDIIWHSLVAGYSPQTNSEVERFNRVMKDGLRTCLADGQSSSPPFVNTLAAYRTTRQGTTGVTPGSLKLSFPFCTPLTILSLSLVEQSETSSPVKARVQFQQLRMSEQHDRRYRAKFPTIQAGDMVRIRLPRRKHTLALVFYEPLAVSKAAGNTNWLTNGQRWNVRRCLRHRHTLQNSSSTPLRFHRESVHRASIHLLTLIWT